MPSARRTTARFRTLTADAAPRAGAETKIWRESVGGAECTWRRPDEEAGYLRKSSPSESRERRGSGGLYIQVTMAAGKLLPRGIRGEAPPSA